MCLLGANGAGKTTFLKAVAGLRKPAAGRILFRKEEITGLGPAQIVRRGVVLVPEGRAILARMTVLENLEMGAYCRRDGEVRKDIEAVLARISSSSGRTGAPGSRTPRSAASRNGSFARRRPTCSWPARRRFPSHCLDDMPARSRNLAGRPGAGPRRGNKDLRDAPHARARRFAPRGAAP